MNQLKIALSLIVVVMFFAGLLVLACAGAAHPLETVFALLFGWYFHLSSTLPAVTFNWRNALGFAGLLVICFAVIQVGGRKMLAVWRTSQGSSPQGQWQPVWTVAALGALLVSFVSGISMLGIAHQAYWLATSPEHLLDVHPESVGRTLSKNNLSDILFAAQNYHQTNSRFPVGGSFGETGQALHGWQTELLPYLDQADLFQQIAFHQPWTAEQNRSVFQTRIRSFEYFLRPTSLPEIPGGYAPTVYSGNSHVMGVNRSRSLAEIPDGSTTTIFAGEIWGALPAWGSATNWRDPALGVNRSDRSFGSPFTGGAHFVSCDGGVRFINERVDPAVLKALATPDGNDTPDDF